MKHILLILSREMRLSLRRPAFWVGVVTVPLLMALLYALPVIAASRSAEPTRVLVVDQTGLFLNGLRSTEEIHFHPMPSLEYAQREASDRDAILYIPLRETALPRDAFLYYQGLAPSLDVQSSIDSRLQALLHTAILEDVYHIDPSTFHSVQSAHLRLHTLDSASGHESHLRVRTTLALVLASLMALSLILFGVQLIKNLLEEKQNRTAEVVATSVRPVELLVGKVGAVALTAMLQLLLWTLLTALSLSLIRHTHQDLFAQADALSNGLSIASRGADATAQYSTPLSLVDQTIQGLAAIRLPLVGGVFCLWFLAGYLLYGSLLALIGAKLGSHADPVQWSLLAASPLLVGLSLGMLVARRPAGSLALFLSLFPPTAPVGFMLRLPFGIPSWQLLLSLLLTLASASALALLAARTYSRRLIEAD